MNTKITIDVLGVSKEKLGDNEFFIPMFDIQVEGDKDMSNVAGLILCAYQEAADNFLQSHSKECTGCIAYLMHKEIKSKIETAKIVVANKLK